MYLQLLWSNMSKTLDCLTNIIKQHTIEIKWTVLYDAKYFKPEVTDL